MNINKTIIVDDADIIDVSSDILKNFYSKWQNVFDQSGTSISEFNSVIEDERVQIFYLANSQYLSMFQRLK